MRADAFDKFLFIVWGIALGVLGTILAMDQTHAQKAERATQQWTLPNVTGWYNAEVHVYDTAGVCLYVLVGDARGGIAAVPKTQLPQGTGCQ
jgi:hypothetical protein